MTDRANIIITGSSGLVGSNLIRRLAPRDREFQIIGFDRDGEPQPPPQVECVCVDLTDDESVRLGLERVRYAYGGCIAAVVHLAAYYDFSGEPSDLYDRVTVEGTQRLLRGLSPFEVEQFIFSSTMLVHAPTEPGKPITEDSPIEGRWDYPQSKIDTERVIHRERQEIPAVTLRIAGAYTDECDSIPLAHQIQRIHEKKLTARVFPGDVSHGQAFVHLEDLIDAIVLSIERRRDLPEEFSILIGEPETYSYDRIQRELARLIHGDDDWETTRIPEAVARTGAWVQNEIPGIEEPFIKPWMIDMADDHYELDISRARSLLGWEPKRRLIKTLPKMVESLKHDALAWYRRHHLEPPSEVEQAAERREKQLA